ncbi:hypothetical protein GGF43_004342, partial [Coemansia sp. RSA 2618]
MLGKEQPAVANVSRPLDLARKYDQKNAKKYIAALVNDSVVWDMQRPLPLSTKSLKFLRFDSEDDPVAKDVFWHSSAHVMGAALERIYGDDLLLCDGPSLPEGGFFYEFLLLNPEQRVAVDRLDRTTPYTSRINQLCGAVTPPGSIRFLTTADMDAVQNMAMEISHGKHAFERMDVDFDFACELFLDNPFKLHFLDRARKAMLGGKG